MHGTGLHSRSPNAMMELSESRYLALASAELEQLLTALDELGDDIEAELASDILSIEFTDGNKFVINSHRAARQIWMAAGTTAWHFDYDGECWLATKTGRELWAVIAEALTEQLGRPVKLDKPS